MEEKTIAKILEMLGQSRDPAVLVGVGDDAAVVAVPTGNLVLSVDACVENSHFQLGAFALADVGQKAVGAALSDLAAMGAVPRWVLLSLIVPTERASEADILAVVQGAKVCAAQAGVHIVGGNISASTGPQAKWAVDVSVTGSVAAGKEWRRFSAQPGDVLLVTGDLGLAAAGREVLERFGGSFDASWGELVRAQKHPIPQFPAVEAIRLSGLQVHAAMDISDGLVLDLSRMASCSKVAITLNAENLPVPLLVKQWAEHVGKSPNEYALYGGEDYQLILSCAAESWQSFRAVGDASMVRLTPIGTVENGEGIWQTVAGARERLEAKGWDSLCSLTPRSDGEKL